jgi:quercetin dioxygenase-like cupin family protein
MKVPSAVTGGVFAVFETSREQGDARGPRAHRHTNMDETLFVLEGSFLFEIDDQPFEAPLTGENAFG